MCTALEFSLADLPPFQEGQQRVRLHDQNPKALIEYRGRLQFCRWRGLYPLEKLKKGFLNEARAVRVQVKANRAHANGVWFHVREGMEGILLKQPNKEAELYILTVPATHYYKTMTRAARMPVLIDQVI